MNLLKDESSPYLRQHMENPVDWLPWGPAALEQAQREGKPILLSIGYAACHWCHVMAHESFEGPATADLMNRHFINIKVDREERPDIDSVYQGALALMGRQGGWPLTMFLLPDGRPFWGGTYFPPQPKYGMPSFREILRGIAESYAGDKDKISQNVASLVAALGKLNSGAPGEILRRDVLDKISGYFLSLIDPANGGIGTAPKFPNLPIMNLLWNAHIRTGAVPAPGFISGPERPGGDSYKAAVIHSLTQMCQGGIYDHLGGGFSRYSVDAEWLTPHFEKMLYDNAQFVSLLTEIYKETKNPLFAARISETVEWVLRDLSIRHFSHTAFAASLDADSEGVEGKYYVWTAAEIERVLGAVPAPELISGPERPGSDTEAFKQIYDVTQSGNWAEGGHSGNGVNILNRLKNLALRAPEEEEQLKLWRQKLKAVRDRRIPPGIDNKILADSNGLMIAALAKAGFALNRPEWIEAGENAFRFVTEHMTDNDGRLLHSWCAGAVPAPEFISGPERPGKASHAAVLEDYANMAEAALVLHGLTQNADYLTRAMKWVEILDKEFHDEPAGGYFMTSVLTADLPVRPKSAHDSASPSGNGVMVGVLARLHQLTGKDLYAECARQTAEAFSGGIAQQVFPFSTLISNSDLLLNPLSLVIITAPDNGEDLQEALRNISLPLLVSLTLPVDKILPQNHPASGKTLIDGKTTAYVCFGQQCLAPVTSAAELEQVLRQTRGKRHPSVANDG